MSGRRFHRASLVAPFFAVLGMIFAGLMVDSPVHAAPAVGHDQIVSAVPSQTPAVNNGAVHAIVQVGDTVVVGGTFTSATSVGGSAQARNYIFAFNASTGALSSSFVPSLNGMVEALIPGPTPGTVYVAGSFTQANGSNASHLTLLNVSTGGVVGNFRAASTNGRIYTIVYRGDRLYLGGNFTAVGGSAHGGLASVNPTTGALDPYVGNDVTIRHNDSGSGAQGAVGVRGMDVSADGKRLIAIGNFKKADGLDRNQIVMLTLGASSSAVTPDWNTNRYEPYCFNWAFDTYMRGVSFSPDGSFFVVNATGGYNAGTLCDASARFETNTSGSSIQPTWVDFTGGDTVWGVTVTEKAVYVGGHQRWMNNSLASDQAGPGAVPRPGLAALDIDTGMPLAWNPGRNPRGAAVYALYATPTGLWMGSDTEYIGNHYQYKRPRLAFFPEASGGPEAPDTTASIPGTAYIGGETGKAGNILYRVDAGGPTVGAVDNGPDWEADSSADSLYRNSGSNAAGWSPGATTDSTVPSTTPNAVFDSERWSPSDNPAMDWSFPAKSGIPLQVRLYFANRCSCTSAAGSRVFDVSIDGNTVLDNFDIASEVGDQVGTMRSFNLTSDGAVDIDFSHVVENPLIDAIEIVRTDQAPPTGGNTLRTIDLSTSGAATAAQIDADGVSWSKVRGSFLAGGKLFYGYSDGNFYSRTFNEGTFGSATKIDPYNDPDWAGISTGSGNTYDGKPVNLYSQLTSVTGMAYARGRLYYTLAGDASLYWRWFNVDSGIIGSDTFSANGGLDWTGTMGMFAANGKLYFVTKANGNLNSVPLANGVPSGSPTVVDGPAAGGNDWRSRALFLAPDTSTPPNSAPTAHFTSTCTDLVCQFDASGSTDSDGTISSYHWDFGDGESGSGQTASHTYGEDDSYSVKLTVADDDNASDSVTHTITVSSTPPSQAGDVSFVGKATSSANVANPSVNIPSSVQAGDTLVLAASLSHATSPTAPPGWDLVDTKASASLSTDVWTRTATASDAGGSVTVGMDSRNKSALILAAYRGVDSDTPVASYATSTDASTAQHTTPNVTAAGGSWVVSFWADKSPNTSKWTAPPGVTTRADVYSTGGGRVSALLADTGDPVAGAVSGVTATTDVTSSRGVSWSIVLTPATE